MGRVEFTVDEDVSTPHFHQNMEIVYILSGAAAVLTEGKNYVLHPEDLVVFNSFQYHELYRMEGAHMLTLRIPLYYVQYMGVGRVNCCSARQPEKLLVFEKLRVKYAKLFWGYQQKPQEDRLIMLGRLCELFSCLKEFEESAEASARRSGENEWLGKVLQYLGEHYQEELSLKRVSEEFFLSEAHLSREFKRRTGVGFAEYLRKIRIQKAQKLLAETNLTITTIAMECGFSHSSTFIDIFKKEVGKTPHNYRSTLVDEKEVPEQSEISFYNLLKFIGTQDENMGMEERTPLEITLSASVSGKGLPYVPKHNRSVNIAMASDLLLESTRDAVRKAKKEIDFRYLHFHGIMDDSMNFYREFGDGTWTLNYVYIDMVLEFILSLGMKPWIEFSYTPRQLLTERKHFLSLGVACVQLPESMEKWELLTEKLMEHLLWKFGSEEMEKWRYSAQYGLYIYYDVCSVAQYMDYYRATFRAVKRALPSAEMIGFGLQMEMIRSVEDDNFRQMLTYCMKYDCLPDKFDFQFFHCDFEGVEREHFEQNLYRQECPPVSIDYDPDCLLRFMDIIQNIFDAMGVEKKEIMVSTWNAGIWQRDPGNDTCYKSVYIVRTILENAKGISEMDYCNLTDQSEQVIPNSGIFHGGYGLLNYQNLKKAGYYALVFMNRLEKQIMAQGKNYIVTKSEDGSSLVLMLYHFAHYKKGKYIRKQIDDSEIRTYNRYDCFTNQEKLLFEIQLTGMHPGIYDEETSMLNRDAGSCYDLWLKIGAPKEVDAFQYHYLENGSEPGYHYEEIIVGDDGKYDLVVLLQPLEIRMIRIRLKNSK